MTVAAMVFAARVGQKASVPVQDTAREAIRWAGVFMDAVRLSGRSCV